MPQREVNKDVFYAAMGDVTLEVVGKYPYTTIFRTKIGHIEIGRAVQDYTDGVHNRYPIVTRYYLSA